MLSEYIFYKQNPLLRTYMYESVWKDYLEEEELLVREYFAGKSIEEGRDNKINIMFSAPKTENMSILYSVGKRNILNAMYSLPYMKDYFSALGNNIKLNILISIRDVVSQNLSCLFEFFSDGYFNLSDAMWKNDVKALFDNIVCGG